MGAPLQTPPAPVQPASPAGGPATPPPPMPPVQGPPPAQKKSNAWIWILGGCLGIVILGIIVFVALGWWGARKVKKETEKYLPNLEQMKENADKWNKEAEEWEKKSQEFRENLPNPEEMQNQFPAPAESNPSVQ